MRRAVWLLAASACASSPTPPVARVEAPVVQPIAAPERASMLSGTPARVQVDTGPDTALEPCTTAKGERDGIAVTTLECPTFNGASAFASAAEGTWAAIFSQTSSLLVTFPRGGAPRVERLPLWTPLSLSPRPDGFDVATSHAWSSRGRGAWTTIAELPTSVTAVAWVWDASGPRIWGRIEGRGLETFRWANGAWTTTTFWPSPSRKGPAPSDFTATRLGDAVFFAYRPKYDGTDGLFVQREGGAAVRALSSAAPPSHPSLALLSKETWPLVAVQSRYDLIVAAPVPTATGVAYAAAIAPGTEPRAIVRPPPARSDREPTMRDGVARCSEALDTVSSDQFFSPVIVTRAGRALLVFVRRHVARRHRWTLIPTRERSFCDWLEERATDTTEVVVADLTVGAAPAARALLAVPIRARVFESQEPRLGAAFIGDTLDVMVATGPMLEHLTIEARRVSTESR
ncbi:MAG TPA: hypothetical protein VGH28_33680 [Polyangiaceae bacterium]|jgi:hypothetical protein